MGCHPYFYEFLFFPTTYMANFCCSIELEPRTLRQGQLSQAREVAADIIQNKEPKEATNTFVQGLRPVSSIKEMVMMPVEEIETLNKDQDDSKEKVTNIALQTACQCSCDSPLDSPHQSPPKEPFSAPF